MRRDGLLCAFFTASVTARPAFNLLCKIRCFFFFVHRPAPIFSPARLMIAEAPSARSAQPAEDAASHRTTRISSVKRTLALSGLRERATTSKPAPASSRLRARPMKPVAPVIKTRRESLIISNYSQAHREKTSVFLRGARIFTGKTGFWQGRGATN